MPKSKKRRLLKNAIVVACSAIIVLLSLEVLFRIFYPDSPYKNTALQDSRIYQKGSYLPWVLIPNSKDTRISPYGDYNVSIEINSYGMRDYEREIDYSSRGILVIGDSMTFGQGVEMNETYPKYLERMLNKGGEQYQVFNGGYTASYSIDSYYLYLKKEGFSRFKPETVIMEFFVFDDLTDISLNNWVEQKNGLPERIESDVYDIEDSRRIRKRGILFKYRFERELYSYLLQKSRLFLFVKQGISDIITTSSPHRIFDNELNYDLKQQFEADKKILLAINELSKENNAKLIIVVIPVKFQIYDELWNEYAEKAGKGRVSRTKPDELLVEFGRENKIMVVDLYKPLYEKNKKKPLFLQVDGHLNSDGHRVAAEEIYRRIRIH